MLSLTSDLPGWHREAHTSAAPPARLVLLLQLLQVLSQTRVQLLDDRHQLFLQIWKSAFLQVTHFVKIEGGERQTWVLIHFHGLSFVLAVI